MNEETEMKMNPERDRWFLGTLMRLRLTAADTGGRLAAIEQHAPAGFSPPLHVHAKEDTLVFVMEGTLTVQIGDERRTVGPGGCAFMPRGVPHSFRCDTDVRLLEVTTPGGFEDYFVELSQPAERVALPAPSEPDVGRMVAAGKPYQVDIIGPPMA